MHNDRILFGSNHMYVYYDPVNKEVCVAIVASGGRGEAEFVSDNTW